MRISVSLPVDEAALIAVANTRHGLEAWRPLLPSEHLVANGVVDRLRTARDAAAFLRALGADVPSGQPTTEQLVRLRDVRECARALAEGDRRGHVRRLARLLSRVTLRLDTSAALEPVADDGWDRFAFAVSVALVALDAPRRRVKLCHN